MDQTRRHRQLALRRNIERYRALLQRERDAVPTEASEPATDAAMKRDAADDGDDPARSR